MIGIAVIGFAVGKGQLGRLNDQVHKLVSNGIQFRQIKTDARSKHCRIWRKHTVC